MSVTPELLLNSRPSRISTIADATIFNDGVMTKEQVIMLLALGRGGLDFVFDPSVAQTLAPVYKTVAELMAAVSAGPPSARVWFFADATIPSDWDLPANTWFFSGAADPGPFTLTTQGNLDNLAGIGYGLTWKPLNSAPCLTFTAVALTNRIVFTVQDGARIDRSGSSAELAQIPDGRFGIYAVQAAASAFVPPPGAGSSVFRGMGAASVLLGSQVQGGATSGIQPGDFAGLGSLSLHNGIDAPVLTAADFPDFSGTFAAQDYLSDGRNFGPQSAGTALGVAVGAPTGTLPTFQAVANLLGGIPVSSAPPLAGPDDWDFSAAFADTDARWGLTAHLNLDPTLLSRGDQWNTPGDFRARVLNGRLLLQTAADNAVYEVGSYELTTGLQADDSVTMVNTIDSSDDVTATDIYQFAWSQTVAGDIDTNNFLEVVLFQELATGPDIWHVLVGLIEGGVGSSLYVGVFPEFNSPIFAISMECHSGSFRCWASTSVQSMHRLGPDTVSTITPDRATVILGCGGTPNRTFGLVAFRRQDSSTF